MGLMVTTTTATSTKTKTPWTAGVCVRVCDFPVG